MTFEELHRFVEQDMRMSHVYQPVMIRVLLDHEGRSSTEEIAAALLADDRSQLEYYVEIVKNMVGRVLRGRGVVETVDKSWRLSGFEGLTPDQVATLRRACERKLAEFLAKRGGGIWDHRRRSAGYISGTLRYEVFRSAKFRCELCGARGEDVALQVDHIVPRNRGGTDDLANLQTLCVQCNAMKRDRDSTDFRAVRASYDHREPGCSFCSPSPDKIVADNLLAVVTEHEHPEARLHFLVIPRRHVAELFGLGMPEVRACHQLMASYREKVCAADPTVRGFDVWVNAGMYASPTIQHCHFNVLPRRDGNPRESG